MANRGRAMMNRANVPEKYRYVLFKYAVTTATKLDMLLVVEIDDSTAMRCLHWAGTVPRFSKHLRTWGETGTVTTKMDNTPKPKNRGVHCMMVGYADGYAGDCYQM